MKRATPVVLVLLVAFLSVATLAQEQTASAVAQGAYWPTHGWRSSTPEAQGMDSEVLAQAFDYVRQNQIPIHSLLIVRNGYVVLDAYFYPFKEGLVHDGASMTKSITSTLIGIAIGEHKLSSVYQPVLSLFPERNVGNRDERKDRMGVEDLLTMTSGLDCHVDHGEITLREMMQSKNWVQFMLDLPMLAEPGSKFEYCSGGMHLLSGIISQTTGSSELEFARRELFQPLGIEDVIWPSDPQGVSTGWGDLHLRPRDMAKIGYLWLNQGRWEGRQIVPAEWMQAATQAHSHPGRENVEYGYGFWVYPQLKSFSLTFSGPSEAVAHLESTDSRVEQRPIGLDGIPRLSPGGRFGLPVALQGRWESNSTFIFDYDEVANINSYRLRLTFFHDHVSIELSEKTGLVDAKFEGKAAGN